MNNDKLTEIIDCVSFRKELLKAIKSGIMIESEICENCEEEIDVTDFNENWALNQVIKTIKKHFLS